MDLQKITPTKLYTTLDTVFAGEPWLDYENETILKEVLQEHNSNPLGIEKALSVINVASNIQSFVTVPIFFEKVVLAFNNRVVIPDVIQSLEIEEIVYALMHVRNIYTLSTGNTFQYEMLSPDVQNYIAACGKFHSWILFPIILEVCQDELDILNELYKVTEDNASDIEAMIEAKDSLVDILDNPNLSASYLTNIIIPKVIEYKTPLVRDIILRVLGAYLYYPK